MPPPSRLLGTVWVMEPAGRIRLVRPDREVLLAADRSWPIGRPEGDWTRDWRWEEIAEGRPETYALVLESGEPLAFWSCKLSSPIRLDGLPYYRLDHLELCPTFRGSIGPEALSVFLLAVIAARAAELGAEGIVFATFPVIGLVAFYTSAGAVQGAPRGWNLEKGLIPFTINRVCLTALKEFADAHLEGEET